MNTSSHGRFLAHAEKKCKQNWERCTSLRLITLVARTCVVALHDLIKSLVTWTFLKHVWHVLDNIIVNLPMDEYNHHCRLGHNEYYPSQDGYSVFSLSLDLLSLSITKH